MKKQKQSPKQKVKADDWVSYDSMEGGETSAEFTNFEELQKRVEVLQECLNEVVAVLKANSLIRNMEVGPYYFDEDEVYKRLLKE